MSSQDNNSKSSKKRRRTHPSGKGHGSDDDNEIISVYSDSSNDGGTTPESAKKIGNNENDALSGHVSAHPQKRAAHVDNDRKDNSNTKAEDENEKYFTTYRTVQVPKGVIEGQLFHVILPHKNLIGVTCPKGVKPGDTILLIEPGSSPPLTPPQIAQLNEQRLLKDIDKNNAKWVAISFWKIIWPVLVEGGWWCRKESLFNFGAVTIYSPAVKKQRISGSSSSSGGSDDKYTLNRDYYESISAVLQCSDKKLSPALVHMCYADAQKRKLASLKAENAKATTKTNANASSSSRRNYSALDRWKYPHGITALKHSRVGSNYQAQHLPEVGGTYSKGGDDNNNGGGDVILEPIINLPEHDKVNPTWLQWANDETFINNYHRKIVETKKEFRPLATRLDKPIGFCLWYYYCRYKVSEKYRMLKNLLRDDNDCNNNNGGGEHLDECVICDDGGDLICCDSCPNAYHLSCLGLTTIDGETEWFCPDCTEEKTRCLSPRKFLPSPSKEKPAAGGGGLGEANAAAAPFGM